MYGYTPRPDTFDLSSLILKFHSKEKPSVIVMGSTVRGFFGLLITIYAHWVLDHIFSAYFGRSYCVLC